MKRWGAFGHYDGTCSSTDCSYLISISDSGSVLNKHVYDFMEAHWPQSYSGIRFHNVYERLGGRQVLMTVGFLVQDSVIERTGNSFQIEVPPHKLRPDDEYGYELMFFARANDQLSETDRYGHGVLGRYDQLARHPYYKVGSPQGCEICMAAHVTYTPYADQAEIQRITSYDLTCITRRRPCLTLPEVLPAAKDWNLYPWTESEAEEVQNRKETTCSIPTFVLARDADDVVALQAISSHLVTGKQGAPFPEDQDIETSDFRVIASLKKKSQYTAGKILTINQIHGFYNRPDAPFKFLHPGGHFIFFPAVLGSESPKTSSSCDLVEDSLQTRAEIKRGLGQLDFLRMPKSGNYLGW